LQVPRRAVDAWLRERGPRAMPVDDDDLDDLRRRLMTPTTTRRR
jgi:hypothetical protein